MGAGDHAGRGALGGEAGADRKAAAERLGDRHNIRRNILPFMGEELAGPPHPALHLVIDEKEAEFVADLAQPLEVAGRRGTYAALALDRLNKDCRRFLANRGAHLIQIAKGDVVETFHRRTEALEVGLVAGGGQGRKGAAVKRALAGDNAPAFGVTGLRLVLARDLERELAGLGPGIAKEHAVGKGVVDEALRQPFLARDLKQVRSVPQALGLL